MHFVVGVPNFVIVASMPAVTNGFVVDLLLLGLAVAAVWTLRRRWTARRRLHAAAKPVLTKWGNVGFWVEEQRGTLRLYASIPPPARATGVIATIRPETDASEVLTLKPNGIHWTSNRSLSGAEHSCFKLTSTRLKAVSGFGLNSTPVKSAPVARR